MRDREEIGHASRAVLRRFIAESNRIEDIHRAVTLREVAAHEKILGAPALTVALVKDFVWEIAQAPIRESVGMNVRVGAHLPPLGGPEIVSRLDSLLSAVNERDMSPYFLHCEYEMLHPFMDGNGRSGRAIWLWRMGGIEHAPLGFLHHFYYQTLHDRSAREQNKEIFGRLLADREGERP